MEDHFVSNWKSIMIKRHETFRKIIFYGKLKQAVLKEKHKF